MIYLFSFPSTILEILIKNVDKDASAPQWRRLIHNDNAFFLMMTSLSATASPRWRRLYFFLPRARRRRLLTDDASLITASQFCRRGHGDASSSTITSPFGDDASSMTLSFVDDGDFFLLSWVDFDYEICIDLSSVKSNIFFKRGYSDDASSAVTCEYGIYIDLSSVKSNIFLNKGTATMPPQRRPLFYEAEYFFQRGRAMTPPSPHWRLLVGDDASL